MAETSATLEKSKFNAGLALLERIHAMKLGAHYSRIAHNWRQFSDCLCGIRSEINHKLTKEERIEGNKFESDMRDAIEKNQYDMRKNIIAPFINYERWLSDKEYKYGFGMPDMPANQSDEV